MRAPRTGMALLALCLTVSACSEQGTTPTSTVGYLGGPAALGGPDVPGASGVFRSAAGATIRLDYETDQGLLLVRHYPSDNSLEICGGSETLPIVEEQLVTDPNFINGVIISLQQTGEVPVRIYPPADGTKDFCTYLAEDWLYKGTGRLLYHDNNLFFDPSRTNAFGWSGAGSLVDRDSRTYQYTETNFLSVDPGVAIRTIVSSLRITPTR